MKKPSIIIVDDHLIFRDGLKSLINNEHIGQVIAEAANGEQFLDLLENQTPDLVLMDIDMPVMNGVEATREAVKRLPNLKVIALTMFGDEKTYYNMVDAGARGFLLKTSGITELENAINDVTAGTCFFSNDILLQIINNFNQRKSTTPDENSATKLTAREIEVLQHICKGLTNEKIAEELHISPLTVKGHRTSLLEKTESNNTASLVIYAIKNKIIEI